MFSNDATWPPPSSETLGNVASKPVALAIESAGSSMAPASDCTLAPASLDTAFTDVGSQESALTIMIRSSVPRLAEPLHRLALCVKPDGPPLTPSVLKSSVVVLLMPA